MDGKGESKGDEQKPKLVENWRVKEHLKIEVVPDQVTSASTSGKRDGKEIASAYNVEWMVGKEVIADLVVKRSGGNEIDSVDGDGDKEDDGSNEEKGIVDNAIDDGDLEFDLNQMGHGDDFGHPPNEIGVKHNEQHVSKKYVASNCQARVTNSDNRDDGDRASTSNMKEIQTECLVDLREGNKIVDEPKGDEDELGSNIDTEEDIEVDANSNDFGKLDAKGSAERLPFYQGPAPCSKVSNMNL